MLIYLDGADLYEYADTDLTEMMKSGFDASAVNVVVLTGGSKQWTTKGIPTNTCALFNVTSGGLKKICNIGQMSLGSSGTLAGFVDFGMTCYPADQFAMVLWDHGGGSIAGYGDDENFDGDSMTLEELKLALGDSKASSQKFEFIGFDACLMASLETAQAVSGYSNYLIASEELEPGYGWDYSWLKSAGKSGSTSGLTLGKTIVDSYINYYKNSEEAATLSVTDLSKVGAVSDSLDVLMSKCSGDLTADTFKYYSKQRENTKTFGDGSPRDNTIDMVDTLDMALKLSDKYPAEAKAVQTAVTGAVVYSATTENVSGANGMSSYYVFGDKESTTSSLETYKELGVNEEYAAFLSEFATLLTGKNLSDINISDEAPEEDSDGNYSLSLTQSELDSLLEIHFTLWEPLNVDGMDDTTYK